MKKLLYVPYEFVGPMAENAKALAADTPSWKFPGDCLSTSVQVFPANMGQFCSVHYARMRLAWTGQAGSQPPTVRLVKADSGPANVENVGSWITPSAYGSPVGSAVDVTASLRALLDAGVWKQLALQVAGKMTINRATLEVYWEVDALSETEVEQLISTATAPMEARIAALEALVNP